MARNEGAIEAVKSRSALRNHNPSPPQRPSHPKSNAPREPNLLPKVRFKLAEFLPPRYPITPETADLGHLMRITVRLDSRSGNPKKPSSHRLFKAPPPRDPSQQGVETFPSRNDLRCAMQFRSLHQMVKLVKKKRGLFRARRQRSAMKRSMSPNKTRLIEYWNFNQFPFWGVGLQ